MAYPTDVFRFSENFMEVCFEYDEEYVPAGQATGHDAGQVTGHDAEQVKSGLGKGLGKASEPTRRAIVQAMLATPSITTSDLAEQLNISTTSIDKHISTLREAGKIQRVGGRSAGHWEVLS